ncbi:hypothetical protein [Verrucomicrobium sp. GAS474]|uniref:hypothetical protein n=1 Tax=Verrucomicrobium sp. GAS474 TaxID=1882831 RepID=UPI0012FF7577|nr:hypothetical protein [Verrucomicrobium sp. GAS474]
MHSILLLAIAVVFASCSTPITKRSQKLQQGMTQAQVKQVLGSDYIVKATKPNSEGKTISLWEYMDGNGNIYDLYFKDDSLVQWGNPASLKTNIDVQGGAPAPTN